MDYGRSGPILQFCLPFQKFYLPFRTCRLEKIGVTSVELLMEKELWPMTQEWAPG
jgi:hypothetical protein